MGKNPLISIVVPIYNAEKYLRKCLDSILGQSYPNLEIILVNDGSGDSSPLICDEYLEIDKRIKVINRKNSGPGIARGTGVKIAKGEYIGFVDADDFIDCEMYELLLEKILEGFDVVQCGYRNVTPEGKTIKTVEKKATELEGKYNCAYHFAAQKNISNYLWNKLFKTKIIAGAEFPPLHFGEDSCVLAQVFAKIDKAATIKSPLYNRVLTPQGLSRQGFSLRMLDNVEAGEKMYDFYQKNIPDLSVFSAFHICSYSAICFCEVYSSSIEEKASIKKQLRDNFTRYYKMVRNHPAKKVVSQKRVFFIELFNFSPWLCYLLYFLNKKYIANKEIP